MKICHDYYIGKIIRDERSEGPVNPFGDLSPLLRIEICWVARAALVYSKKQDRYVDLPVSVDIGDHVLVLRFDTQPLALRGTRDPHFVIGRLSDIIGRYGNKNNISKSQNT